MPHQALNPLIRRLESITFLSEDEKKALLELPARVVELRADADIVREGDRPSQCCLLVEGFLTRYKCLSDGKRQIMAFYVPGDIPDLLSLHMEVMDHSLPPSFQARLRTSLMMECEGSLIKILASGARFGVRR